MEKKYYDLIISLIKAHKKYSGLENLLNDIADDVYSRAKLVMFSISDENILEDYLTKIVSSSIIIISKKANQCVRKNEFNINDILNQNTEKQVILEKASENKDILIEDFDKLNDTTNMNTLSLNSEDNDVIENINQESMEYENFPVENTEFNNAYNEEKDKNINKDLVDLMINGKKENNEFNNEDNCYDVLEEFVVKEDIEELEDIQLNEENNELEEFETVIEEEIQENDFDTVSLDEVEEIQFQEENNDLEEFETVVEEEIQENDFDMVSLDDNSEFTTQIHESLELEKEENNFDIDNNIVDIIPVDETLNSEIERFDFGNFDTSYFKQNLNIEELFNKINSLSYDYPNINLLEICDLKFNQKLSISEISDKIGCTNEDILNALDIIINAIKD